VDSLAAKVGSESIVEQLSVVAKQFYSDPIRKDRARWGIIEGLIQPIKKRPPTMEAERINALSALLNDLTSREAELRRYL
jgi:hypothetical protein